MGTPRPPRPNNVVALSQYRARLGRGRKLRRADALLEAPNIEAAVRALPGDELYYVLHEIGLAEGADILARATSEQLTVMLDFAVWERDQLNPAAYGEWLAAIAAAPFERIGRWMKGIDSELLGLILRRGADIYDLSHGDAPEEPQGTFYPTPDGFFVLDVRVSPVVDDGPDPAKALIGIVDALYRTDIEFARRMIVGAIGELDAELEESAFRWRQARMANLGFADYYEALEVYRELDPATVRIGDQPSRARTVVDARPDGASLRVPTALAERLGDTDSSAFSRAARKLTAGDELDDLRFALVALTNRVLAANRIAPGDDEAVATVLDRLVATLNLAMERLAQGDDERGAAALRTIPLARLFRLGVSLSGKVKRLALTLRREGPFGAQGFNLAETDDATVLEAVTRLRPMFPRLLDNPSAAGERPFRRSRRSRARRRRGRAGRRRAGAGAGPRGGRRGCRAGGRRPGRDRRRRGGLDLGMLARTALVARLRRGGRDQARGASQSAFGRSRPPRSRPSRRCRRHRRSKGKVPKLSSALGEERAGESAAAAPPPLPTAAARRLPTRWLATLAPLEPVLVSARRNRAANETERAPKPRPAAANPTGPFLAALTGRDAGRRIVPKRQRVPLLSFRFLPSRLYSLRALARLRPALALTLLGGRGARRRAVTVAFTVTGIGTDAAPARRHAATPPPTSRSTSTSPRDTGSTSSDGTRRPIAEYRRAYELRADAQFLFQIAESYRQLGATEQALFYYDRYLAGAAMARSRHRRAAGRASSRASAPRPRSPRRHRAHRRAGGNDAAWPPSTPTPIWRRWWLSTAVGVVLAAGVTAAALAGRSENVRRPPPISGTRSFSDGDDAGWHSAPRRGIGALGRALRREQRRRRHAAWS